MHISNSISGMFVIASFYAHRHVGSQLLGSLNRKYRQIILRRHHNLREMTAQTKAFEVKRRSDIESLQSLEMRNFELDLTLAHELLPAFSSFFSETNFDPLFAVQKLNIVFSSLKK